jgi:hypothetical protein
MKVNDDDFYERNKQKQKEKAKENEKAKELRLEEAKIHDRKTEDELNQFMKLGNVYSLRMKIWEKVVGFQEVEEGFLFVPIEKVKEQNLYTSEGSLPLGLGGSIECLATGQKRSFGFRQLDIEIDDAFDDL